MECDPTKRIAFTKIQYQTVPDKFASRSQGWRRKPVPAFRRGANNFKHIGGGRLLLERFAQLVQQPRVLEGETAWAAKF